MKILIIVFLSLFLFSCESHNSIKPSYSYSLNATNNYLKFTLNKRIVNKSNCLNAFSNDSSNYLFYLSGYTNLLCVFDINAEKLVNTIVLQKRGPNGVGDVKGFEVITFDSIYITSSFRRKLFLINQKGKLISTIDYSKYIQNYFINAANFRTLENMRLGFKNSKIYLPFYPGYDEGNYKSIAPEKIRFIAEIDTAKQIANTLNIGFPKDYWNNTFYPTFFGFFIEKDKFYINYMYDDWVLTSSNSMNWRSILVKSKFINVKKTIPDEKGLSAHYPRLVADTFRNVFYRFVIFEQKNIKNRTHIDLIRYPQKFSIIILNKDLRIIGETVFPADIYDMHGYFITKDGLYLSLSNPFNPNYNVDLLEFQLFKINKNEE